VIYELHVRGFTAHPSAGLPPQEAGTDRGLISKIPYLQDLGITAVELLPVFAFNPLAAPDGHRNDWGYQPVAFFAPHAGYGCSSDPLAVIDEFRDLVKALHRAGIEVILDVVFNHTAEGMARGRVFTSAASRMATTPCTTLRRRRLISGGNLHRRQLAGVERPRS